MFVRKKNTKEEEKEIEIPDFGADESYPPHLQDTTLLERAFAFFYVRTDNAAAAYKHVSAVRDKIKNNNKDYSTQKAYELKNKPKVKELIDIERAAYLREIRIKTVRYSDAAINALLDLLGDSGSAIARVQSAIALIDIAGVKEDKKATDAEKENPIAALPAYKRQEIIQNALLSSDDK